MTKKEDPITFTGEIEKQLFKKVYREYSTKFTKFFTWEKVEQDDEKKANNRRTQTRP